MTKTSRSWPAGGTRRQVLRGAVVAAGAVAMAASSASWSGVGRAQQDPIRIGFSMALTGGLAGAGKPALIAMEIWRDDVNAPAGLLGGRSSSCTTTTRPSPRPSRGSTPSC
jgi:hypothetical protein